ncbi:MAG: tRNA 2-selenouridine(34) synthase MnmH [Sulfuricurvum sp.]|jgi:tRNA 2-selenouridine synthase|uniref:tRNA 2-selenouridine(34) synthase MnmH n=1 Tax=Sulfuricurvum sp. TaxID=2025608 RepID=UPI0025DDE772|nr:tRNA 2-selenouridine(34) synthase MnmH [Sulfuricurvum sp.]MCK9372986.1 tRNA 2-selenouridine(34) synthase MnmH [Sulfuricurvum sp.]
MIQTIPIEKFLDTFNGYDLIIDARSPREFGESHIPNAKNFYALNDEEHHEVGSVYKQKTPFEARVLGASYVCGNAARHIHDIYPSFTPNSKIAIYCARGGMRSSSLGIILSSIGYPIDRVIGGYKAYRTYITRSLDAPPAVNFITLSGNTGCGKSDLLQELENVIDLEKMANHYGSVFGDVNGEQPTQKEFQNRLAHALFGLNPDQGAFIEAESKRIGKISLPGALYKQMEKGFRIEITAPIEQRIERIMRMYDTMDEPFFSARMERISPYISRDDRASAMAAFDNRELDRVAEILLTRYYDKVYKITLKPDMTLCNDDLLKTVESLKALQSEQKI